jgi:hypothetical protein
MPTSGVSPDEEEVQITFVRSKNGKRRTIPVWFTLNQGKMELMPMYGLKTNWFGDVEKSGSIELKVKDWTRRAKPKIVRDTAAVDQVRRRFSGKYGEGDMNKYYKVPLEERVALEIVL